MYLKRVTESLVERYLSAFSVVGMTGPRQSGKSTLLRELLPDYRYVTFDDFQQQNAFNQDPVAFLKHYDDRVIFDEVQFVPDLFSRVKIAVDNDRQNYGKFVLTGSSQFAYLKKASESLAGRIGLLSLLPLQYAEMPRALREASIFRGGYPELVLRDYKESEFWYGSYLETYLNKDVRALSNIGDMRDFSQFIRLIAVRCGQILDQSMLARDLGVSVPTIKRWISILEASYIIFLLPAYHNNFGKRIIKRPKLYFYDTGLVSYLTGIKNAELYHQGPMSGLLFENYVVSEVLKNIKHRGKDYALYYLRTSDQAEVDLIVDKHDRQDFIEIKKTSTFLAKMARSLRTYSGRDITCYVLYNGEALPCKDYIHVLNYTQYLDKL